MLFFHANLCNRRLITRIANLAFRGGARVCCGDDECVRCARRAGGGRGGEGRLLERVGEGVGLSEESVAESRRVRERAVNLRGTAAIR